MGNVLIGATVTASPGGRVSIRVMHMRAGRPLISAEHEPHLPALQFHRQARSGGGMVTSMADSATGFALPAPAFASSARAAGAKRTSTRATRMVLRMPFIKRLL